jgi:hypothetical protein
MAFFLHGELPGSLIASQEVSAMAAPHAHAIARGSSLFEFVDLERLPCGCVTAAYRAPAFEVGVVAVEAKGPHCLHSVHAQGRVLGLGGMGELFDGEPEE